MDAYLVLFIRDLHLDLCIVAATEQNIFVSLNNSFFE